MSSKGNRRIASIKTEEQWKWEQDQMESLGFEIWKNANGRSFYRAPHGQLIRIKNADRYLKAQGITYNNGGTS